MQNISQIIKFQRNAIFFFWIVLILFLGMADKSKKKDPDEIFIVLKMRLLNMQKQIVFLHSGNALERLQRDSGFTNPQIFRTSCFEPAEF